MVGPYHDSYEPTFFKTEQTAIFTTYDSAVHTANIPTI